MDGPQSEETYRSTAPLRILVVDDDSNYARMVQARLKRDLGAEVYVFNDPRDALKDVRAGHAYDAAIVDYNMPGMNGDALVYELRQGQSRGLRAIVATALPSNIEEYRALCRRSRTAVMTKEEFQEDPRKMLERLLQAA